MNQNLKYFIFYLFAFFFLIGYLYLSLSNNPNFRGWLLTGVFISLAIGFRGSLLLKGFSYTLVIFAAVSLAMHYPSYFQNVGNFKLSGLILPLLQIIMFGMGTELSVKDFRNILKKPKGIL